MKVSLNYYMYNPKIYIFSGIYPFLFVLIEMIGRIFCLQRLYLTKRCLTN